MHSALDNTAPHFVWYGQKPSIHELRTFVCDIYPVTSFPKNHMIAHKKYHSWVTQAADIQ